MEQHTLRCCSLVRLMLQGMPGAGAAAVPAQKTETMALIVLQFLVPEVLDTCVANEA